MNILKWNSEILEESAYIPDEKYIKICKRASGGYNCYWIKSVVLFFKG